MKSVAGLIEDIKNGTIAEEVVCADGISKKYETGAELEEIIKAFIASENVDGSFTIKNAQLYLRYSLVEYLFKKKLSYTYQEKKVEYDFLADCDFKEVFKGFPSNYQPQVLIKCDIRFIKFSDNTMQMVVDNVSAISAILEPDDNSEFNKFIANAIRRFDALKAIALKCDKYIANVMRSVISSSAEALSIVLACDIAMYEDQICRDYESAANITALTISNSYLSSFNKKSKLLSAAKKWNKNKDKNDFTESELAFFYKYRNPIHNQAVDNKLWDVNYKLEDDILLKFSEMHGGGKNAPKSNCNVLAHSGHLTKDIWISFIKKSKANPFKNQLKRELAILADLPHLERFLTKRAVANALMFEYLYWILMLRFSSYTAIGAMIAVQTSVIFCDRDRAKSQASLQDYDANRAANLFNKYDVTLLFMSGASIVTSASFLDLFLRYDFITLCVGLVISFAATAHCSLKHWVETEKRGYEENIYVAAATSGFCHLAYSIEGIGDTSVSVKIAANICVFAGFYMYDKYQDKLHQERVREKELELQSSVAI